MPEQENELSPWQGRIEAEVQIITDIVWASTGQTMELHGRGQNLIRNTLYRLVRDVKAMERQRRALQEVK